MASRARCRSSKRCTALSRMAASSLQCTHSWGSGASFDDGQWHLTLGSGPLPTSRHDSAHGAGMCSRHRQSSSVQCGIGLHMCTSGLPGLPGDAPSSARRCTHPHATPHDRIGRLRLRPHPPCWRRPCSRPSGPPVATNNKEKENMQAKETVRGVLRLSWSSLAVLLAGERGAQQQCKGAGLQAARRARPRRGAAQLPL